MSLESELIIAAITTIAVMFIVVLMFKIGWERVFEKCVGEGERNG